MLAHFLFQKPGGAGRCCVSLLNEFEQMSSANPALLCAGENFVWLHLEKASQDTPRCAICHAASEPASPAPMTVTVCLSIHSFSPRGVGIERSQVQARRYAAERLELCLSCGKSAM